MPKKRSIILGAPYVKEKTKEAEEALIHAKSVWAHYLKKDESLRVELNDLCRRFQAFSKAAVLFLDE